MVCPNCQRDQPPARYCVACGLLMTAPSSASNPLDEVPEGPGIPHAAGSSGTFAFGRGETEPESLQPSDWTDPMRLATAAWVAFSALIDAYLVFQAQDAIRQFGYPTAGVNSGAISSSAALASAQWAFDIALGGLVLWVVVKAFLGVGAYAGRSTWVFFACMGLVGVYAALGLVSLAVVVIDLGHGTNLTAPVVALLVQLTAAGLLGWMVAGLRRYGPWAATRVSRPS